MSVSGSPSTASPSWPSPRSPLEPTRIAKLRNALGVSTPLPARPASPIPPTPYSAPIHRPLSPSPNGQPTSKYLLHVVPPTTLPHNSTHLTPPPHSASGYHPNFRRGTLVPVHATLQAQLGAIAREYALPSTAGLVLYLVSTSGGGEDSLEPGPRLSEEIWRLLWARVVEAEGQYIPPAPPSPRSLSLLSPTPSLFSLPSAGRSTPSFAPPSPSVSSGHSYLRPQFTLGLPPISRSASDSPAYPITPTSVGPKSATPSSPSPSDSFSISSLPQADPETPLTSAADPNSRANSLESMTPSISIGDGLRLPGLANPHSLVPVLAKVEFDIDRQKASWWHPWIKSRRMNHAKRTASASTSASRSHSREGDAESARDRRPIIDLTIGTKDPMPFSQEGDYAPLAESPESEYEEDGDFTVRMRGARDPLGDVFGEDEDEWGAPRSRTTDNPNIVPLAIAASELTEEPLDEDRGDGEEDVREVSRILSSSSSATLTRKHIPPPLVLHPHTPTASPLHSPMSAANPPTTANSLNSSTGTRLPYLRRSSEDEGNGTDDSLEVEIDKDPSTGSSGSKSARRKRAVYDFNLDELDIDSADSKNQFLMKAQLDEIEKTLIQLSPRSLTEFEEEQIKRDQRASQSPRSPRSPVSSTVISAVARPPRSSSRASSSTRISQATSSSDVDTSSTRVSQINGDGELGSSKVTTEQDVDKVAEDNDQEMNDNEEIPETSEDDDSPAWPATPFAVLKQKRASASSSRSSKSSKSSSSKHRSSMAGAGAVPQLAVNGVTTSSPLAFRQSLGGKRKSSASVTETESRLRQKSHEEETASYGSYRSSPAHGPGNDSPLIPLSPDPFGRFSSSVAGVPEVGGSKSRGSVYWEDGHPLSGNGDSSVSNGSLKGVRMPSPVQSIKDGARSSSPLNSIRESNGTGKPSRFSADDEEMSRTSSATNVVDKRSTMMSVKGIKKLWRKSSRSAPGPASSSISDLPPIPPSPLTSTASGTSRTNSPTPSLTGRASPSSQLNGAPPQRPSRPQDEVMDLPSTDDMTDRLPAMLGGGLDGNGRVPAMLGAGPPAIQQVERMPPGVSAKYDTGPTNPGLNGTVGLGINNLSEAHPNIPLHPSIPLHPTGPVGANRPRMGSTASPIMPAKMLPGGGKSIVSLAFDQESPYPVPGSGRKVERKSSVPPPTVQQPIQSRPSSHAMPPETPTPTNSPPLSGTSPGRPKSILKSKSSMASLHSPSLSTSSPNVSPAPSPSPPSSIGRARSRSILKNGSVSGIAPPDIPPSPKIPEQFLGAGHKKMASRGSISRLAGSLSVHSRSGSSAQSMHSHHSGSSGRSYDDSVDESEFEIVSPKMRASRQF